MLKIGLSLLKIGINCAFINKGSNEVVSSITLTVASANSVSPLKIAVANRLIHAIHKNCIVYLFL